MKWAALIVMMLAAGVTFAAQPVAELPLTLAVPEQIKAGDAFGVLVEVNGAAAGEKVSTLLFNGLRRFRSELILGTGGIARWAFDEAEVTSAGRSLIIARYGTQEVRQTLDVLPGTVEAVEVLTTANSMPAESRGGSTIIALPSDQWGNPIRDLANAALWVRYPDGTGSVRPMSPDGLLYWAEIISFGEPGRTQITVSIGGIRSGLELRQTAGDAARIALNALPQCLPYADGRDILTLDATVTDRYGVAVADGTRVMFMWEDGSGVAVTTDAHASLRLPAPHEAGIYHYRAATGDAVSPTISVRVGDC
jgi:hypothetical protein